MWPEGHGTGHQEVEEDAQGPQVNRGPNVVIILQFKGTVSWDLEGNTLANWNQCTSIYFNMWIMRATVGLLNSRVIYELQESYIKKDNLKRKWHVKNMTFDHMRCCFRHKQCTMNWFYILLILCPRATIFLKFSPSPYKTCLLLSSTRPKTTLISAYKLSRPRMEWIQLVFA